MVTCFPRQAGSRAKAHSLGKSRETKNTMNYLPNKAPPFSGTNFLSNKVHHWEEVKDAGTGCDQCDVGSNPPPALCADRRTRSGRWGRGCCVPFAGSSVPPTAAQAPP